MVKCPNRCKQGRHLAIQKYGLHLAPFSCKKIAKYNTESCRCFSQKHPWAMSSVNSLQLQKNSRAGEGHQSSADHNEVQNIPEVTKVRAGVEQQSQVNHLGMWKSRKSRNDQRTEAKMRRMIDGYLLRPSHLNHHFKSEDSREHVVQILENLHHRTTAEMNPVMLMNTPLIPPHMLDYKAAHWSTYSLHLEVLLPVTLQEVYSWSQCDSRCCVARWLARGPRLPERCCSW